MVVVVGCVCVGRGGEREELGCVGGGSGSGVWVGGDHVGDEKTHPPPPATGPKRPPRVAGSPPHAR